MALPFFGIVTEIIPVFARKPLFGYASHVAVAGCHPRLAEGRRYASGGPHTAQLGGCRTGVARSAASRPSWSTNQSPARPAACSSVPGSSNRCVAPGTTASSTLRTAACACAHWLSCSTAASRPPTISSVGARTSASRGAARSGRPPRDDHRGPPGRPAAAQSAAAAPVLAPKYPIGGARHSRWARTQDVTSASRPASSSMSKTVGAVDAPRPG